MHQLYDLIREAEELARRLKVPSVQILLELASLEMGRKLSDQAPADDKVAKSA